MLYGVIDVGSNSVRLMISDGIDTLYKKPIVTALASKVDENNNLSQQAIKRTVEAVSFFVSYAREQKVDEIYIFATAAVRNAPNKKTFIDLVKDSTGIDVDVVDGVSESYLGALGALNGKDGAIIDIGGASAEIAVFEGGKQIYGKSLDAGVVVLHNKFDQNKEYALKFLKEMVQNYKNVPKTKFYGIGGTATSIAAILQHLEVYDSKKVDGFIILKDQLDVLTDKLYSMSIEERKQLKGLQPERALVIAGGCLFLSIIMDYLEIDRVVVSEKDNLEGYLTARLGGLNGEK